MVPASEAMNTPRYTFQWPALAMPRSVTSACGTERNVAVMMKCSANTPAYSGMSVGRRASSSSPESERDSFPPVRGGSAGTAKPSSARPLIAITSISVKMPGTPIAASSTGASTSASTNDRPMLAPITAMARVRTSGRVRSASSADTAAETAPAPCTQRAMASMVTVCASAPISDPAANSASPTAMTGLRPKRSDQRPNGICSSACVRP